jgi:hypothetical protein
VSRYCGISILLIYSGLLVGCGGGDSGEYRTFQSQSESQSAGVAVASGPAGAESGAAAVADTAASSETGAGRVLPLRVRMVSRLVVW